MKRFIISCAIIILSMSYGQEPIKTDTTHIINANFNVEGMLIRGGIL